MSEFIIIAQDRHAKQFHIFKDGVFKISSHKSPGNIAQELLDHGDAVKSDRFELRNMSNHPLVNWTVGSAAIYSDEATKKYVRPSHFAWVAKNSAHLPPEPINAGGGNSSLPSSATLSTNDLRGSTKS